MSTTRLFVLSLLLMGIAGCGPAASIPARNPENDWGHSKLHAQARCHGNQLGAPIKTNSRRIVALAKIMADMHPERRNEIKAACSGNVQTRK